MLKNTVTLPGLAIWVVDGNILVLEMGGMTQIACCFCGSSLFMSSDLVIVY